MTATTASSTATSSAMQALAHVASRKSVGETLHRQLNQLAAAVLLLIFSPLMLAVALLIMRRDGAPVFFGHYRVGLQGRLFRCYKFRTMYRNSAAMLSDLLQNDSVARAEWDCDQKLSNDPRVTPVGAFLRRTSLDELPQLFNVLRGEMALVGPRPITLNELSRYGRVRWNYLSVLPGMTGLWQVSGRSSTTYEQRVALDREYVDQRGLRMDLSILLRTVRVVLARDGAH